MFNFSQDGVTIASMLDTRKANKDDKFPVKIRVTYRRERKYYSTGKDLNVHEWEKLPGTKSKISTELKRSIQTSFDTVRKAVSVLLHDGGFAFDLLDLRLGRALSGSVNAAFTTKIEELEKEGRIGTKMSNKDALSSFTKFSGKNIQFKSITPEWLKKYERWMIAGGNSYTTVGIYLRSLRAIINEALEAGIIRVNDYPFGKKKYQIPTGEGRKMALSLARVKQVLEFHDGTEETERYRDLWFLSYLLSGANIGDVIRLKDSNVVNGEIRFYRSKTALTSRKKKELVVALTPEIQEIIAKYGVPDRKPTDYIFPYLHGAKTPTELKNRTKYLTKSINLRLDKIGNELGIPDFTTYTARHSFATISRRMGVSVAYISETLGHSSEKTTQAYLDSFEAEARLKNSQVLTDFKSLEEKKNTPEK